jgi:hypothetical protein
MGILCSKVKISGQVDFNQVYSADGTKSHNGPPSQYVALKIPSHPMERTADHAADLIGRAAAEL